MLIEVDMLQGDGMAKKVTKPVKKAPAAKQADKRPRNAAATRQAILESAITAFARYGYNGVGVREIAREAGVTAILVNRYFGSKERLFAEAADVASSRKDILTSEVMVVGDSIDQFCKKLANVLVKRTTPGGNLPSSFSILLNSLSDERSVAILREIIERRSAEPLAALLPGVSARERATLLLSFMVGIQVMRQIVGIEALANMKPNVLSKRIAALFKWLLT